MALNILSVNPSSGNNKVPIDTKITIELDNFVDPFTVPNGINLYVLSKAIWDNPELAKLDTPYSEVLDIGEVNTYFPFTFQITNQTITITPTISLLPDSTYFIDIFPGNDSTRYLSSRTTGTPLIVNAASGTIDITSAYTGTTNDTFEITFSSSDGIHTDTIDVYKGINSVGSFRFTVGNELNIGELKFKINGTLWEIGDSIAIPVYRAVGLTNIYRAEFITTKYTTVSPRSNKIQYVSDSEVPFKVIKTYPDNKSVNNRSCNPIVIKFNKPLNPTQNLTDSIDIKRINFESGDTKNITKYLKIENDTLKIYMISTTRQV